MVNLSKKQRSVALGMGAAALTTAIIYIISPLLIDATPVENNADRLVYALGWSLFPTLTLFAGIAFIARHRFFNSASIDGENPEDDGTLIAARAYLQNTVEQLLFALPVWFSLAVYLPREGLGLIPALALWFTVCRILFAAGYRHGAPARAFGFAGTFYPTVLGAVVAIYLFIAA